VWQNCNKRNPPFVPPSIERGISILSNGSFDSTKDWIPTYAGMTRYFGITHILTYMCPPLCFPPGYRGEDFDAPLMLPPRQQGEISVMAWAMTAPTNERQSLFCSPFSRRGNFLIFYSASVQ